MFFLKKRFDEKSSLQYQKEVSNDPGFSGKAAIFVSFETARLLRGWYYVKAAKIEADSSNIILTPFTTIDFPYNWVRFDIRQITGVCFDPEIFKDPTKYVARLGAGAGSKVFVRCAEYKKVWEKGLQYQEIETTDTKFGLLDTKATSQFKNQHDVELPC